MSPRFSKKCFLFTQFFLGFHIKFLPEVLLDSYQQFSKIPANLSGLPPWEYLFNIFFRFDKILKTNITGLLQNFFHRYNPLQAFSRDHPKLKNFSWEILSVYPWISTGVQSRIFLGYCCAVPPVISPEICSRARPEICPKDFLTISTRISTGVTLGISTKVPHRIFHGFPSAISKHYREFSWHLSWSTIWDFFQSFSRIYFSTFLSNVAPWDVS